MMLNTLWQDIRFGVRKLMKYPGFTFVVTLTLALGIGEKTVNSSIHLEHMITQLGGFFSFCALGLALLGLYGLLSFSVVQRTREFGVRAALGALPHDVLYLIILQGMKLTFVGLLIGITAAFVMMRVVSSILYGVEPTDPVTFIGVSLILLLTAAAACYIPARSAANINPMTALRYE